MTRERRLWAVLVLNVALIAALLVVGLRAHSLAVLAEGGDYIADAATVALSLFALWLGARSRTPRHPSGFPRATSYAAFANVCSLLLVCAWVIGGAAHRLLTSTGPVEGVPVLVVSAVAALVMTGAVLVLRVDADDDGVIGQADDDGDGDGAGDRLAMRAVLLDTVADAASAAAVAVTGAVMAVTNGWYWLDPAVAALIAFVVAWHAILLLRDVVAALRAG